MAENAGVEDRQRLRAIATIASDVLGRGASARDERNEPEIRDMLRIAEGNEPRTKVGRDAWEAAKESRG